LVKTSNQNNQKGLLQKQGQMAVQRQLFQKERDMLNAKNMLRKQNTGNSTDGNKNSSEKAERLISRGVQKDCLAPHQQPSSEKVVIELWR